VLSIVRGPFTASSLAISDFAFAMRFSLRCLNCAAVDVPAQNGALGEDAAAVFAPLAGGFGVILGDVSALGFGVAVGFAVCACAASGPRATNAASVRTRDERVSRNE
jgi:hypothetical protein